MDCRFGVGRLCAITDASGTHTFAYDARGNRVEQVHTVMAVSYRHARSFDASVSSPARRARGNQTLPGSSPSLETGHVR